MKNMMLFLCVVATNAAPIFPIPSYSIAELPLKLDPTSIIHSIVRPVVHEAVISPIRPKLKYTPLEGAPIEEHIIDSLPPPTNNYSKQPMYPNIHHDKGSVFESTRPHIEYAPGIQKPIAPSRSPMGYTQHD